MCTGKSPPHVSDSMAAAVRQCRGQPLRARVSALPHAGVRSVSRARRFEARVSIQSRCLGFAMNLQPVGTIHDSDHVTLRPALRLLHLAHLALKVRDSSQLLRFEYLLALRSRRYVATTAATTECSSCIPNIWWALQSLKASMKADHSCQHPTLSRGACNFFCSESPCRCTTATVSPRRGTTISGTCERWSTS